MTEREKLARAAAKAYCHAIDKGASCVCGDNPLAGCLNDAFSWLEAFEAAGCRVKRRPMYTMSDDAIRRASRE